MQLRGRRASREAAGGKVPSLAAPPPSLPPRLAGLLGHHATPVSSTTRALRRLRDCARLQTAKIRRLHTSRARSVRRLMIEVSSSNVDARACRQQK